MNIFKKIFGNKNTVKTNAEPKTWREAATKATKGNEMYEEIRKELDYSLYERIYEKVKSNYMIMKFFPEDIPKSTVYHVINEHFKGRRSESICEDIQNTFFDISNKDMRKITFTICSICSTASTQTRSNDLDINWYVWRTSEDSRVRKSHKKMNKVIVNWDDPPSPEKIIGEKFIGEYHAGECEQCRCYAEPIIDLKLIKFPHRVYYNGQIQVMKKAEFMKIYRKQEI